MLDVFELLEELNDIYPTPGEINHNITQVLENSSSNKTYTQCFR